MSELYTIPQAAKLIGKPQWQVRRLIEWGYISGERVGSGWRPYRDHLDMLIVTNSVPSYPGTPQHIERHTMRAQRNAQRQRKLRDEPARD